MADGDPIAGDGWVTLREAVAAINAGNDLNDQEIKNQNPGNFGVNDAVHFGLGLGPDVQIKLTKSLELTRPMTIDGFAEDEENARPNSNPLDGGINALMRVEIYGDGDNGNPGTFHGLDVQASGVTIRGLVINRFAFGIRLGVFAQDVSSKGTSLVRTGRELQQTADTVIGGAGDAKNYISWNGFTAVKGQATRTVGVNNFVGQTVNQGDAPNGRKLTGPKKVGGIDMEGDDNVFTGEVVASNIGIGYNFLGNGNRVQNGFVYQNQGNGVEISGNGNIVQGSRIGTDELGGAGLGNLGHGIYIDAGNSTLIGGSLPYANLITGNTLDGISVVNTSGSSYANTILTNSIYANGGLGIDLANNDVTPNDNLDPDDGPNHFQNFPVITSATFDPSIQWLNIVVTLNSTPDSLFTFELFLNSAADPSGYGEGETHIGGNTFTTDASGNAVFGMAYMGFSPDPTGKYVTATATRWQTVETDTSEFSQAVQVTGVGGGGGGPPGGGGGTFGMSSGDNVLAIGADAGDWPLVQIADARTGRVRFGLVPYAPTFRGGVRTAVADVNGDGVPDIITAPGAGGLGTVFAFDGVSGKILHRLTPFPGFAGGLFVSAGDIDGDRKADIVVSMDSGGGDVAAYSGATGVELRRFGAFAGFTGGVRIALGDVNGDGRSDITPAPERAACRSSPSSAARISRCSPVSSRTNRRSTAASMSQPATSTATAEPTSSPARERGAPPRRISSAATVRCLRAFGHTAMRSRAASVSRPAMSMATAVAICC